MTEFDQFDYPMMHSNMPDVLLWDHPLAFKEIHCCKCGCTVHAKHNECIKTWFEWLGFAICFDCFAKYCYKDGVVSVPGFMVKAN